MDVMYAIVKGYVIERNDVFKRHSNVITILRTSAIKLNALLKNLRSELKGVQENESFIGASGRSRDHSLALHGKSRDARQHYENTPIQIYRKFHLQKLKIFR